MTSPTTRRSLRRVASLALGALLVPLAALSASAHETSARPPGAVFVQLNGEAGNEIAAYARAADGTLSPVATYPTGGLGGTQVGAPLDALASQGGLVLAQRNHVLLAVNAGSDTVTAFPVHGASLGDPQTVASGGSFPSSIAVHGDLVYVLNAGGDGSISGFRLAHGRLEPIADSTRSLGLGGTNPPVFIDSPAQVGFSKDGGTLIVTTKSHNELLAFGVDRHGRPSASPTTTASAGAVPFSFVVDTHGLVQVTEAGTGATSTYAVTRGHSLRLLGSSASGGGAALCWNIQVGRTIYGANAGSASLSAWVAPRHGAAVLTAPVAATTGAGPIDLASSRDGRFLYVQEAVDGTIGVYSVAHDGSLTRIQTVTGLPAFTTTGMEGIAAT
ncbi:lactonase family protein [Actinotalea sp. M2MS4P-6]|uniref:lactonase family protein n=1 Tax=Actinotalea sp. M2MS4P-6 TaxID=2983762 RepID=UPI0021E4C849|nr:lactonase family protein [Actinotalea sp. M2MS4P-6]MCV2393633.1 lactonase family protein [Actinotalea sp. M2MS4P-6]